MPTKNTALVIIIINISSRMATAAYLGKQLRLASQQTQKWAVSNSPKNRQGWDVIHKAVAKNRSSQVKILCSLSPNNLKLRTADEEGLTPLHVAANFGSVDSYLVLLKEGADHLATTASTSLTPLQVAAASGHVQLVMVLLNSPPYTMNVCFQEILELIHSSLSSSPTHLAQGLLVLESIVSTLMKKSNKTTDQKKEEEEMMVDCLCSLRVEVALENTVQRAIRERLRPATALAARLVVQLAQSHKLANRMLCTRVPTHLMETISNTEDIPECQYAAEAMTVLLKASSETRFMHLLLRETETVFHALHRQQSKELHVVIMSWIESNCHHRDMAVQLSFPRFLQGLLFILEDGKDTAILSSTMKALRSLIQASQVARDEVIKQGLFHQDLVHKLLHPLNKSLSHPAVLLFHAACRGNRDAQELLKQNTEAISILVYIVENGVASEILEPSMEMLWAIAGESHRERRALAATLGPECLTKLLDIGTGHFKELATKAICHLSHPINNLQKEIVKAGGVITLIKIARVGVEGVRLEAMRALQYLSTSLGMRPNRDIQRIFQIINGVQLHLDLSHHGNSDDTRQQALCTLAAFTNQAKKIRQAVMSSPAFSLWDLLAPFQSTKKKKLPSVSLTQISTVSYLAYNSLDTQSKILSNGGVLQEPFTALIATGDQYQRTEVAFHMIVLARVMVNARQTDTTAMCITLLMNDLKEAFRAGDTELQVHIAALISGLLNSRGGLAAGFMALKLIPLLVRMLSEKHEGLRRVASISLCSLSSMPAATRTILGYFRTNHMLYPRLMAYRSGFNPSQELTEGWEHFRRTRSFHSDSRCVLIMSSTKGVDRKSRCISDDSSSLALKFCL